LKDGPVQNGWRKKYPENKANSKMEENLLVALVWLSAKR